MTTLIIILALAAVIFLARFVAVLGRAPRSLGEPPKKAPPESRDVETPRREQLPEATAAAPRDIAREKQNVQFHALWNESVTLNEWTTLFVYMWAGRAGYLGARNDFERRATSPIQEYESGRAAATLARGTEITIIPQLPGAVFNPPYVRVKWYEEWQCVEFRMKVESASDAPVLGGQVLFYVGPLAVAEIAVDIRLRAEAATEPRNDFFNEERANPYRTIFVSYSHDDTRVVEALERAYRALGDSYLRDVGILRSGQQWSEAILAHIPEADVFQLCWSAAASASPHVEQEWRTAAQLRRRHFIRPVYWDQPMPPPPRELENLHFAFLPLDAATG
jgi:hypothetical protein